MNARPEIRNALLVKRMNYWLIRALHPEISPRVPVWRARKNYWSLIRRHSALAARHGLRETDVF
jgi:hypothetical protein